MTYEIWGQDSPIKGLRIIRFQVEKSHMLKWIGPFDGPDDDIQTWCRRSELIACGWVRLD